MITQTQLDDLATYLAPDRREAIASDADACESTSAWLVAYAREYGPQDLLEAALRVDTALWSEVKDTIGQTLARDEGWIADRSPTGKPIGTLLRRDPDSGAWHYADHPTDTLAPPPVCKDTGLIYDTKGEAIEAAGRRWSR